MVLDYSLYLVTDSTPAVLGKKKIEDVVQAAVYGGATIVQYREKHGETANMIKTAEGLRAICHESNTPLIINDRVDVALAVKAQGVHLGQTDMSTFPKTSLYQVEMLKYSQEITVARQLLGPEAIIGATVSSIDEAVTAIEAGADYLGIGTVYATATKDDTKVILGPTGVRDILDAISVLENKKVPTIAIGGINAKNIQRVMFKSQAGSKRLDGVAVVSAIVAADDAKAAAQELRELVNKSPGFFKEQANQTKEVNELLGRVNAVIREVGLQKPLCHNMTNLVVQNFAANVALAIGSSPIMANNGDEASELAALGGSLVVNMGSVPPEAIMNYERAAQAYNSCDRPVLFDPVGAGATKLRRGAVRRMLANCYFEVLKGNENEIRVLLGDVSTQQKGVDSSASTSSDLDKATLARDLAAREHGVVVLTGETDYLSDGKRTYAVKNGHEYLGRITGTGCTLGTTIAACLAAHREDKLLATLSAMLMFEVASERAAIRLDVKGPGTFVPAFIDELYEVAQLARKSDGGWSSWLASAKVEEITLRKADEMKRVLENAGK
ncbi:MAG: hypothetical protein Q9228_002827 [Teloschistes exilis]